MRLIGIDYGRKRVGIAISDEEAKFALPHAVWQNSPKLVEQISKLCIEKKADAVIIGESRNHDGSDNEVMRDINFLKSALDVQLSIPVYLEPEFYTSAEASRVQGVNDMHDASAAALILKSYLDKRNNGNNR